MRQQLMSSVAACAIITAMGGPVSAADQRMPVKAAPAPALYAPNWTGWYIGGHLGYGKSRFSTTPHEGQTDDGIANHRPSGLVGGMHGGYNWQMNSFVFGLEGDLSATGWEGNVYFPGTDSRFVTSKVNLLGSLRARLGITFDRTLLYVTGGLAYTKAKFLGVSPDGTLTIGEHKKWGSVLGGGVEWKQTPNFSWRAEGLYYRFNSKRGAFGSANVNGSISAAGESKFKDAWVVRLGATYHFDGGPWGKGPIAARY